MTAALGRFVRRWRRDARGAELVEFALASLGFLVVVFSAIEGGRMIWQYNAVAAATKDGVRWAAARGATANTVATPENVRTYILSRMDGMGVSTDDDYVTTSIEWSDSSKEAGTIVKVTVQKSFTPIVPLTALTSITLQSKAEMVVMR